jgi:hypothetical protein
MDISSKFTNDNVFNFGMNTPFTFTLTAIEKEIQSNQKPFDFNPISELSSSFNNFKIQKHRKSKNGISRVYSRKLEGEKVKNEYQCLVEKFLQTDINDLSRSISHSVKMKNSSKRTVETGHISKSSKKKRFDPQADIKEDDIFEIDCSQESKGDIITSTYKDDKGKVIKVIEEQIFNDGSIVKIEKNSKGQYDGNIVLLNVDGCKIMDTYYDEGIINGRRLIYYPNNRYELLCCQQFIKGIKVEEIVYGRINTNDDEADFNQSRTKSSTFDDDGKERETILYDDKGDIKLIQNFIYDEDGSLYQRIDCQEDGTLVDLISYRTEAKINYYKC